MDPKPILNLISKLVRASLERDMSTLESSCLTLIRKIKKEYPSIADEIAQALSYHNVGGSVTRSIGIDPPPTDKDSYLSLARVEEPDEIPPNIILTPEIQTLVERFIRERKSTDILLSSGIQPPTNLLLFGPPGVGKTLLSKYLSCRLSLPLVTLDLASSISSYLGSTGKNLKKIMDYAKCKPSILFLDEFDAIAKKRNDPTDLGELKRIVNVLLKEIENWPSHSILIAATNHADLLDKAIWRRFDHVIEIKIPNAEAREELWKSSLSNELFELKLPIYKVLAEVTEGLSAADICQLSKHILRRVVLNEGEPIKIIISELKFINNHDSGKFNKRFAQVAKQILGKSVTQKQIADWLNISTSTVNHHIKSLN